MEKNIQECIEIYKKQMEEGSIQIAYAALIKFITELKINFPNQYSTGNISFGYLDYSYFPFLINI